MATHLIFWTFLRHIFSHIHNYAVKTVVTLLFYHSALGTRDHCKSHYTSNRSRRPIFKF